MRVERLVIDTNVLISAAIFGLGKPAACYDWAVEHATLLASAELLSEVETRLARPKFAKYVSDQLRSDFVARLVLVAELVPITGTIAVCRDPDDDKVLETAVAGRADCIVTGDKDLLVLGPFRGIPILTPAAFLLAITPVP